MNMKAKGSQRERKSRKLLEAAGYLVTRSAASLGEFDLIAVNQTGIRFIQVKSNCWPGPVEREAMKAAQLNLPQNSTVECWRWNDNAREPIIRCIEEF